MAFIGKHVARVLSMLAVAAPSSWALAQECQDVEYVNEGGEKLKPLDCEERTLESAKIDPVVVCPAPVKPKPNEFHGLSISRIVKHKMLDGSIRPLSDGLVLDLGFGIESQAWVLQNAKARELGKGKIEVNGDLVEALLFESGRGPKAHPDAGARVSMVLKVRRDGEALDVSNVLVNGKRRFGCGRGSYDGSFDTP